MRGPRHTGTDARPAGRGGKECRPLCCKLTAFVLRDAEMQLSLIELSIRALLRVPCLLFCRRERSTVPEAAQLVPSLAEVALCFFDGVFELVGRLGQCVVLIGDVDETLRAVQLPEPAALGELRSRP